MLAKLPLRWRLSFLLGAVMVSALVLGVALLALQAGARVRAEAQAATGLAQYLLEDALLRARAAPAPEAELAHVLDQARKFRHLRIYREGSDEPPPPSPSERAPAWFAELISPPERTIRIPLQPPLQGALMITLDPSDEMSEIWQEVTGLAPGVGALAVGSFFLMFLAVSKALAPAPALADSLSRLERGERRVRAPEGAAPEFVVIADRINALAATLDRLDGENHKLLQRMIEVQEGERKDIARDLHDEFGPFLFAIRAGVGALARKAEGRAMEADCAKIDAQVAALQQVNRRILARLRPAALDEMGLTEALQALAAGWRDSRPETAIEVKVAERELTESAGLAAFRVVQEGLTNAFRHAAPSRVEIEVARDGPSGLRISVRDDGAGLAAGWREGLGLRGMRERLAALGGSLKLANRPSGGAQLEARLPL